MTATPVDVALARRELVLVAVILVAFARLVDRSDAFLVVILLPVVILLAGSAILRADERPGRPFESLLVPAVLTGGTAAALHARPRRAWASSRRWPCSPSAWTGSSPWRSGCSRSRRASPTPTGRASSPRPWSRRSSRSSGVAALVPGGLPEPGSTGIDTGLSEGWMLVLALGDALVALVLGYRVASVRYGSRRDAVRSALTYAIVIAVAAGAIRAMDVPRLVGPAALTLVFYLWDALHATAPARRREPRFLWETILLAVLAVVVVAWNLRLRV